MHNNCWATFKGALSKHSVHKKGGVFQVTSKNAPFNLKKGDHFYIDKLHNDHLEVFDKNGNVKSVLNLDGTINIEKTNKALKEKRKIDVK